MTSCSEEQPAAVNGVSFEIQSYEDFLWKKDPVDTIQLFLNAEFKECEEARGSLVFLVCDSDGKKVSDDVVTVYVGGEKAENNRIVVPVKSGVIDTKIGLVISRSHLSEDVTFDWHLKLVDDGGLKKVLFKDENGALETIGEDDPWIYGTDIFIKNTHVANSLKTYSITGFWIVLAVLVALHLLSRRINKPLRCSAVQVGYDGDSLKSHKVKGCYRVVFTNKAMKVGLLERFFKGNIAYIQHEFWTTDLIIKSTASGKLRISPNENYIYPEELMMREEFDIKNSEGRTATLFIK